MVWGYKYPYHQISDLALSFTVVQVDVSSFLENIAHHQEQLSVGETHVHTQRHTDTHKSKWKHCIAMSAY